MAIKQITSDLIKIKRGIIVHGVSCRGVMGSGVALAIKSKYPKAFKDYHNRVFSSRFMDDLLGHIVTTEINPELFIVSGFTQKNFGRNPDVVYVNYEAVRQVFVKIDELAQLTNLPVYFPLIGCGLGNGDWSRIQNTIETTLSPNVEKFLVTL